MAESIAGARREAAESVVVLRREGERLQRIATRLFEQAAQLEAGITEGCELLRGHAIREMAATVVDPGEEVHYTTIALRLSGAGYAISGLDPQNTLLAELGRSPDFERVGSRTGLYRRRNGRRGSELSRSAVGNSTTTRLRWLLTESNVIVDKLRDT